MRSISLLKFVFVIAIALSFGCERNGDLALETRPADIGPTPAIAQLPFGNPSNAAIDDADDLLLVRDHYAMSYNDSRGTMNWVAWFTRRGDLADRLERPLFEIDTMLPDGIRRIHHRDYSGSGYDRGHMIPSADRFGSERQNAETFLMTNIVPQTPSLNQYRWNELEKFARSLVYRGNTTYTIAGVAGERGRLKNRVTVPETIWKIIVVFPKGREEISKTTRVIAVEMPNDDIGDDKNWRSSLTTVRRIEQRTGLDFFSSLPRDVQDSIENKPDAGQTAF